MNKTVLILLIVIFLLAVLFVVMLFFKKKDKVITTETVANDIVIKDENGDPISQDVLPQSTRTRLVALAQAAYNNWNGANPWGHDTRILETIADLSDVELLFLNSAFNKLYLEDTGESFYQWLDNEVIFGDLDDTILRRLQKIGVGG